MGTKKTRVTAIGLMAGETTADGTILYRCANKKCKNILLGIKVPDPRFPKQIILLTDGLTSSLKTIASLEPAFLRCGKCGKQSQMKMPEYENARRLILASHREYEGMTILVTGRAYIDCEFFACTFIYSGDDFIVDRCGIHNCLLHIDAFIWGRSYARAIERLLGMFYKAAAGLPHVWWARREKASGCRLERFGADVA
jgi:hypothetical protein